MSEILAHLRSVRPQERVVPSLQQVRLAVQAVRDVQPLATTLALPEFANWLPSDLVSTVEALGKYIAQSRKSAVSGSVVGWDESGLLFPLSQDEISLLKGNLRSKRKQAKAAAMLPSGTTPDSVVVHIPMGWTQGELSRDVQQSVATAVATECSDAEIVRFIERNYRRPNIELSADHVYLLVWLAEQGLLEKLLDLGPSESALAAVLVKAWDTLQVFTDSAYLSLTALAANAEQAPVGEVVEHLTRARHVAPGEIDRILREAETSPTVFAHRLRSFVTMLRRSGMLEKPEVPSGLTVAHAQMICESAGLLSGESEEKALRSELRERLSDMGLVNDLDREIGEGVRAWRLGLLDEFYATRAARASGEVSWAQDWEAALEAVSA